MNEAIAFVDSLAVRLKAPAEHIWQAYVAQARVEGLVGVVQYILLGLVTWYWVRNLSPRLAKIVADDTDMAPAALIGMLVGWIGITVCLLVAFFSLPSTIAAFANPPYWAIQKLLGR